MAAVLAVAGLCLANPALAARHSTSHSAKAKTHTTRAARITRVPVGATDPQKDAALIEDGRTGKVLYARNETALRHPASLTKMMTLYLLFDALRGHRITMQTQMPVSFHATQQKPTKLYLRRGQTIDVETAIRAIVIRSANDVAVVIAEALGGTESNFAQMMNDKARQLGMKDTNYHNASGLPDPLQITTAVDLAILARHLAYDFPQYFPYFSTMGFNYKGTYYPTHDNLIGRYDGADGIKTGFTGASGFNLATSVTRDGVNLIGIVMGGRTAIRRDLEMMHLLDTQFAAIEGNPALVARGTPPWQTPQVAAAEPPPQLQLAPPTQVAALAPPPPQAQGKEEDEDAAESRRAPDENYSVIHADAPQLATAPVLPAAPAVPPLPLARDAKPELAKLPPKAPPVTRPLPRPALATSAPPPGKFDDKLAALFQQSAKDGKPLSLSSKPAAKPAPPQKDAKPVAVASAQPQARPDAGEGDSDSPERRWTIQIGVFADQALAKAQLDRFAIKARDVVGQASRIVAPITGSNGHVLYRARFGVYAEREARQVCGKLNQRGQTCFAVASR